MKIMLSRLFFYIIIIVLLGIAATKTAAQCTPCSDGSTPDGDRGECGDIVASVTGIDAGSSECQTKQLEAYQNRCCYSAPSICTVCPDGAAFNAETTVPNPTYGAADITCADMNGELKFLDSIPGATSMEGTCGDTLLQRSKSWCGCPNTNRGCTLCADGSRPTKMDRIDKVVYKWDCAFFDFVSSMYSSDECPKLSSSGEILNIDAAAFCGCPNAASARYDCSLCRNGEIVKTETDLGPFTCGELSLSVRYINNLETCISEKTKFRNSNPNYIDTCCFNPADLASGGTSESFCYLAFIPLAFMSIMI